MRGPVADRSVRKVLIACLAAATLAGCAGGEGTGPAVRVRVPPGAGFAQVTDSLEARGLIKSSVAFRIYAKVTGAAASIQPGTYEFKRGTGWKNIIDDLRSGKYLRTKLVIPE